MSSPNFLVVDEQPLTLEQALTYLQTVGKFQPFLIEILYQYVIHQELKAYPGLQPSPEVLEQVLIDFRMEQELTDPQTFQAWLDRQGVSYEAFRQQYLWYLTCERLKTWVSQSRLPAELDKALETQLRDEIFSQWLSERVSAMNIKLEVN